MENDEWKKAPALNYERSACSSCLLGTSLYVYGDSRDLPIERLSNISGSPGNSSDSWETIQMNSSRNAVNALMVPQRHSD